MSTKSLLLAVLSGALALFIWGGFSHMFLLKGVGFRPLPSESALTRELQNHLAEDGLYFFPGIDLGSAPLEAEQQAWEQRFRRGPTGFLIYHPNGDEPVSLGKLGRQALSHLFASLLVGLVVMTLRLTWRPAAGLGLAMGGFACSLVASIYWNWYGYPTAFFLAQCADVLVGGTLLGAVVGAVLGNDRRELTTSA